MNESRSPGNGADRTEGGARFPQHLGEAGRQIRGDAQNLVTHVSEVGGELQSYVTEMVRERPFGTLAVVAGVGYLLGGGLSSRLSVLALGVGTRFAMAVAAREVSSWALQSGGSREEGPRQLSGSQNRGGQNRDQSKEQNKENRGGSQQISGGSSQTH